MNHHIIKRRADESIKINDNIDIYVLAVEAGRVTLLVEAPEECQVLRFEIWEDNQVHYADVEEKHRPHRPGSDQIEDWIREVRHTKTDAEVRRATGTTLEDSQWNLKIQPCAVQGRQLDGRKMRPNS